MMGYGGGTGIAIFVVDYLIAEFVVMPDECLICNIWQSVKNIGR